MLAPKGGVAQDVLDGGMILIQIQRKMYIHRSNKVG